MKKYIYNVFLTLCVVLILTACTGRKNDIIESTETIQKDINADVKESVTGTFAESEIGFAGGLLEDSENDKGTISTDTKNNQSDNKNEVAGNGSENNDAGNGSSNSTDESAPQEDDKVIKDNSYEGDLLEPVKNGSDGVF